MLLLNIDNVWSSIAQMTVYGVCPEVMSIACGEGITKKTLKKPTLSVCA